MIEQNNANLLDLYSAFELIDEDTQGGYARVAEVISLNEKGNPKRAFKVMRGKELFGEVYFADTFLRFQDELRLLLQISTHSAAPTMFPRVYDSGFVQEDLIKHLENYEQPPSTSPICQSGLDINYFLNLGNDLEKKYPGRWLPYIVIELMEHSHNLYRQIRRRRDWSQGSLRFFSRLPVGETIYLALQMLDSLEWLHKNYRHLHWDWKPEHIYWGSTENTWPPQVHLIDFNVTKNIDIDPKPKDLMKAELFGFCGAVLYPALTMVDLDHKAIVNPQQPTLHIDSRFCRENLSFYDATGLLDDDIVNIMRRALHPNQGYDSTRELFNDLHNYALHYLGLEFRRSSLSGGTIETRFYLNSGQNYWDALKNLRLSQNYLIRARSELRNAWLHSERDLQEYENLIRAIDNALESNLLP